MAKATVSNIREAATADENKAEATEIETKVVNAEKESAKYCKDRNEKAIKSDHASFAIVKDAGINAVLHAAQFGDPVFINELIAGLVPATVASFKIFISRVNKVVAEMNVFTNAKVDFRGEELKGGVALSKNAADKRLVQLARVKIVECGYDGLDKLDWFSKSQAENTSAEYTDETFEKSIVAQIKRALSEEAIKPARASEFLRLLNHKKIKATGEELVQAFQKSEEDEKRISAANLKVA